MPVDWERLTSQLARGGAAGYLAKRELPRPAIPWDEVIRIKREAQANLRARGER